MKPSIRPFEERDFAEVVSLWELVFPDDPPRNHPPDMIRRKQRVQPELFLVGVVEGSVRATVLGGYDGVRGWIYHLAVHPDFRRRGLGTSMMTAVEEGLRDLGCPKINLQIRAANTQVAAFYGRLGYTAHELADMGKLLLEER